MKPLDGLRGFGAAWRSPVRARARVQTWDSRSEHGAAWRPRVGARAQACGLRCEYGAVQRPPVRAPALAQACGSRSEFGVAQRWRPLVRRPLALFLFLVLVCARREHGAVQRPRQVRALAAAWRRAPEAQRWARVPKSRSGTLRQPVSCAAAPLVWPPRRA